MDRRQFIGISIASGMSVAGSFAQGATPFPVKPVSLVVAFAPGGGTDALARALAVPLSQNLGQPVVVENKAGAGALIGSEFVSKAAADGYTLLATSAPHASNPSLISPMPFDTLRDFAPICLAAKSPFVLTVLPDSPIQNYDDLIKQAKLRKLTYGSSGNGTNDHFSGEMTGHLAGISMTHIPYKGTGPAVRDLLGGHLDLMFANIMSVASLVQAGKLRAIAVTTAQRSSLMPDLPTMQEIVKQPFDFSAWTGILAPARTNPEVISRLNSGIRAALATAAVQKTMTALGADIVADRPDEFEKFIEREIEKGAAIVKAAGIKL